jgi:hypothetical protein
MPGSTLRGPDALVCQAEELGDIPHTLAKCNHNRNIRDTRNGVANLGKSLDERAQGLPRALLNGV